MPDGRSPNDRHPLSESPPAASVPTGAARPTLQLRSGVGERYPDVLTPEARAAIAALAPLDAERKRSMAERIERRSRRFERGERLAFLPPDALVPGAGITAAAARAGEFDGSEIPPDLRRQWIQGTGPAARPRAGVETNLRNVAYALLSGADGWMFDGEDALGQVDTMSLENQRSLKLAIAGDPLFLEVAEAVAAEMNAWSRRALGRDVVEDWRSQLGRTTRLFRPRGLHLDDRHVRWSDGSGFSASIVDAALYVANNADALHASGASVVLYLPKIQTAGEAALWHRILSELERHVGLPPASIKTYVLVEQLEACFQLMEIRAALGPRFVGYNTGRWDYINSVADAMAFDRDFVDPDIDTIVMTYGYMRHYEDRVRRAVNTPDRNGRCALWQGGMEPNIPVGSERGVRAGMERAVAGARRERDAGASGKWVAHWKMVPIVRPVWAEAGADNQLGRSFPPLTYTDDDALALTVLEDARRTVRGARDLISVALQYGNAFERGYQAVALKPADFFDDDDVLYLMEDMATGEIRVSILWEWLHKAAVFTQADADSGTRAGETFSEPLFERLLEQEYDKLLHASDRNVHDDSKATTLPIAREIVAACVRSDAKLPWFIDLLNATLGNEDLPEARRRIDAFTTAFTGRGERITANLDFEPGEPLVPPPGETDR